MRYTIQNISHRAHDLDEQVIDFHFEIHFTEPEELVVKYFHDFFSLSLYIRDKHPEFYSYIEKVRQSIDAWGPKEPRIIEEIGEEAVQQVYVYLEEFLMQAAWVPAFFDSEKKLRSLPLNEQIKTQQTAEKITADLGAHEKPMKKAQRRYFKFCETVEKQIRQTAAEVYPELVDGDAEQLKEFKHLFVRDIQAMHERIEEMLSKYKDAEDEG